MYIKFRLINLLLTTVFMCSCASAASPTIAEPKLPEISGLASSRLTEQHLWLHNDGGHSATLYAIDTQGRTLARLKVHGQRNRDWEDMASFSWRGQHWLVVADIGDNNAQHKKSTLHFIEEPALPQQSKKIKLKLKPTISVSFRYEGGARDAESIAFDPISEQLLILSKRERPGQLYALSVAELFAQPKAKHLAKRLGPLPWAGELPRLATLLRDPKRLVSHGMATGFDISSDGLQAVVLGYQQAVLLRRNAQQSWAEAKKTSLPPHRLKQAEAIAFSLDERSIYITSEGKNAPLMRVPLPVSSP